MICKFIIGHIAVGCFVTYDTKCKMDAFFSCQSIRFVNNFSFDTLCLLRPGHDVKLHPHFHCHW